MIFYGNIIQKLIPLVTHPIFGTNQFINNTQSNYNLSMYPRNMEPMVKTVHDLLVYPLTVKIHSLKVS